MSYGLKILILWSSLPGVAYFELYTVEPVMYIFVVTFCQGNMNSVREMSGNFEEACCYERCVHTHISDASSTVMS